MVKNKNILDFQTFCSDITKVYLFFTTKEIKNNFFLNFTSKNTNSSCENINQTTLLDVLPIKN